MYLLPHGWMGNVASRKRCNEEWKYSVIDLENWWNAELFAWHRPYKALRSKQGGRRVEAWCLVVPGVFYLSKYKHLVHEVGVCGLAQISVSSYQPDDALNMIDWTTGVSLNAGRRWASRKGLSWLASLARHRGCGDQQCWETVGLRRQRRTAPENRGIFDQVNL